VVDGGLTGGGGPTGVVTLGMSGVGGAGTQPAGSPSVPPGVVGSVVQGTTPSFPCERTGKPAAATAAGFAEVWSTMRLLTVRGSESITLPLVWAYDVGPGAPTELIICVRLSKSIVAFLRKYHSLPFFV